VQWPTTGARNRSRDRGPLIGDLPDERFEPWYPGQIIVHRMPRARYQPCVAIGYRRWPVTGDNIEDLDIEARYEAHDHFRIITRNLDELRADVITEQQAERTQFRPPARTILNNID